MKKKKEKKETARFTAVARHCQSFAGERRYFDWNAPNSLDGSFIYLFMNLRRAGEKVEQQVQYTNSGLKSVNISEQQEQQQQQKAAKFFLEQTLTEADVPETSPHHHHLLCLFFSFVSFRSVPYPLAC